LGPSSSSALAPAGAEIATRPFQLVTGRSGRPYFGAAAALTCQNRRLVHGGKIQIDPMITHTMPLAAIIMPLT
jgi:S-(hydroxymethyl)glutathione dehydrogenase/alcohol dehydrogenase